LQYGVIFGEFRSQNFVSVRAEFKCLLDFLRLYRAPEQRRIARRNKRTKQEGKTKEKGFKLHYGELAVRPIYRSVPTLCAGSAMGTSQAFP
jgi:hypothetical protein